MGRSQNFANTPECSISGSMLATVVVDISEPIQSHRYFDEQWSIYQCTDRHKSLENFIKNKKVAASENNWEIIPCEVRSLLLTLLILLKYLSTHIYQPLRLGRI